MPDDVIKKLSHNGSLPAEELDKYHDDPRARVKMLMLKQSNLSTDTLHKITLAAPDSDSVISPVMIQSEIASHPNTSSKTLDLLSHDADHNEKFGAHQNIDFNIVKHPNTSSSTLHNIFNRYKHGHNYFIVRNILKHPNISANDLDHMIKNTVRVHVQESPLEGVFENPNTRSDQIEKVYNNILGKKISDPHILASNSKTPKPIVKELVKDPQVKKLTLKEIKKSWKNGNEQ